MKKYPIVEVEWEDITSWDSWHTMDMAEKEGCITIKTVGYLVSKDKNYIRTVSTMHKSEGDSVSHQHTYPRSIVRSIRRLDAPEKRQEPKDHKQ